MCKYFDDVLKYNSHSRLLAMVAEVIVGLKTSQESGNWEFFPEAYGKGGQPDFVVCSRKGVKVRPICIVECTHISPSQSHRPEDAYNQKIVKYHHFDLSVVNIWDEGQKQYLKDMLLNFKNLYDNHHHLTVKKICNKARFIHCWTVGTPDCIHVNAIKFPQKKTA